VWRGRSTFLLVLLAVAAALGCTLFFPAPAPVRTLWNRCADCGPGRTLLVLLPGRGGSAQDFVDHGFVAAVQRSGLPVDTVAVDAGMGYYLRRTLSQRVAQDVLAPARAAGYQRLWLMGISMGGLGALMVARTQPEAFAGVLLLAPYLGDRDVIDEVAAAGGLARWTPPERLPRDDYQRDLWRWLKRYTVLPAPAPPLYLGYGTDDRFARAHVQLAAVLPPGQVYRVGGGHDWASWQEAFRDFLDTGALAGR
jgi:pimeloyl-ACP methyl ester carboxylesterase